jgi:hypothetical protein
MSKAGGVEPNPQLVGTLALVALVGVMVRSDQVPTLRLAGCEACRSIWVSKTSELPFAATPEVRHHVLTWRNSHSDNTRTWGRSSSLGRHGKRER